MYYFLSRTNRFYAFVIRQRIVTLYALSVAVLFLLILIWYICCHSMCASQVARIQRHIEEQKTTIDTISKTKARCASMLAHLPDMKKQCMMISQVSLKKEGILPSIMHAARTVGIVINQCTITPGAHIDKKKGEMISCSFNAQYDQLMAFFEQLQYNRIPLLLYELQIIYDEHYYIVQCYWQLYNAL